MALARRGWLVLAVGVALAGAFGRQQFGTHNTPPGQPALAHVSLESIEALRADFNSAANAVRLIVLLSPT
jgi:hypothetical protein